MRMWAGLVVAAVALGAMACQEEGELPLPPPVELTPIDERTNAEHPLFEPLPGAEGYFGLLNGGTYRYEVPHEWNGRLVMYMRGWNPHDALEVEFPPFRSWLIDNGYAWAASSFDRRQLITDVAADQTAALWDYVVQEVGRPERTYVVGSSMGGAGAVISAERYSDRYDGALSACGIAGLQAWYDVHADTFVAAAYITGLDLAWLSELTMDGAVFEYILPKLEEPEAAQRFEVLWISLTGGPRAFGVEGYRMGERERWWYFLDNLFGDG